MSKRDSMSGAGTAILIRRLLFVVSIFALTGLYLIWSFNGLSQPMAMDQAQIAREVARGHDLTTKCVRPLAIHQASARDGGGVPIQDMYDTYHAPMHPLLLAAVFKLVGVEKFEDHRMDSIGYDLRTGPGGGCGGGDFVFDVHRGDIPAGVADFRYEDSGGDGGVDVVV